MYTVHSVYKTNLIKDEDRTFFKRAKPTYEIKKNIVKINGSTQDEMLLEEVVMIAWAT